MNAFNTPNEVDEAMGWRFGRAEQLAKRGFIPHYRLPDGSIRFKIAEVLATATKVRPLPRCVSCGTVLERPGVRRTCIRCQVENG